MESVLPASPLARALGMAPGLAPGGLWLTGEDGLRLTSFNAAAGVTLALEGLQLLADGRLQSIAERHVPNTDRTSASSVFRVGEGWLQLLHVRASGGTPRRGQCFVVVELVRGANNGNVAPLGVLAQGYVTDTMRRGWPGSPLELSPEGPGVIRAIAGTDPAAGAEITETVPTNARWRFLGLTAALVTDATVANRTPRLVFDDGTNTLMRFGALAAVTASTSVQFSTAPIGFASLSSSTDQSIACPSDIVLAGGMRIVTATVNLQAGDNWGQPRLLVEEWIED